ncbi:MAG: acyl-CoA dehydrogenase family protein [Myxococcota bacterium]
MRFEFTEDQLLLQSTVRDFLEGECGPERVRALWEEGTGRSRDLWRQLAEVGLVGALVPEAHEGMGLDEVDFVLLAEEVGRAGLAEPVIGTAAVAAPLLAELGSADLAERWLKPLAVGDAIVAVGHPVSPFVDDAHVADWLLLFHDGAVHAVAPGDATLTPQRANDPARRIQSVAFAPGDATRLADGDAARALADAALDRGALACAAGLVGAADRLIALAVDYAGQRQQFGVPIGSFQAVKHMLADAKVKLEYARPLVYRAAHSVANAGPRRSAHVSMAKTAAGEAASRAARVSLQVHGAIGYTWEQDVHIWMRRAASLDHGWGLPRFHRQRMADFALAEGAPLGAGATFL